MGADSRIEWCDHTFNPWQGCTKISPACDNCYAESWAKRSGLVQWGNHPRRRASAAYWQQPLKWNRQAACDGVRRKVFCASLADVFDNQAPEEWRQDLWELIERTPSLDFLLLTKRPQNIAKMLPYDHPIRDRIWLGTTVENDDEAARRIPIIATERARVRFLSCEPLLSNIRFGQLLAGINWVICGGESGPKARPYAYDWALSLIEQCAAAGVACFHKQVGAHPIGFDGRRVHLRNKKGNDPGVWPAELRVRQFPRAGEG